MPKAPFTRYSRLSNPLSNRLFVQHGCQTVFVKLVVQPGRFDNRLNEQLFVQHGCQTRLTTDWMFVYTIQPVVKPAVSCKRSSTRFNDHFTDTDGYSWLPLFFLHLLRHRQRTSLHSKRGKASVRMLAYVRDGGRGQLSSE